MNSDPTPPDTYPFRLAIYLPVLTGEGESSSISAIEAVETFLCEHLGGATSYPAKGLFKRATGWVEREAIQVVEAYCDTGAWDEVKKQVFDLAAEIARDLAQESIACSVQGNMHFVEPCRPPGRENP